MASDDKKMKAEPAAKSEAAAKTTSDAKPAEAGSGGKSDAAPAGYSRGEGQKPVSKAYKENWNAIYGKKKKKR